MAKKKQTHKGYAVIYGTKDKGVKKPYYELDDEIFDNEDIAMNPVC